MNKLCVLLLFLLFISCSVNEEYTNEYAGIPVESVELLTSTTLYETCRFEVKYKRTQDCLFFDDFYIENVNNTTLISVRAIKVDATNCKKLPEDEIITVYFEYKPTESKIYKFRFWKGVGTNGQNVYIDYEFEVN